MRAQSTSCSPFVTSRLVTQSRALPTVRFQDDPWGRLPWLTAAALLLVSLSLLGFLKLLEEPPIASVPAPVRVEVTEIPDPIQRVARPPASQTGPTRSVSPLRVDPAKPIQEILRAPVRTDTSREEPYSNETMPPPQGETSGLPPSRRAPQSSATPAPSTQSSGTGLPGSPPSGGGQMGARALYKPLPKIPDALRRRSIDAVALARFRVAADGSAQVELIEPTIDPELSRALLDSLKRWPFFPAMQDGKPVASSVDIRIPVSVK